MMTQQFSELLNGKNTAVFIGEAGSGKSEIAINFAVGLQKETERKIHFFDLDQTKPLFRSRDAANQIRRSGMVFHCNTDESIEDVATIAPGVIEAINEPESYVILDIGGNEHGARMIGQFSQYLNNDDSIVFFLINPYRPWSRDLPGITETITRVTRASRTGEIQIISNPNFGLETTVEDVLAGNEKLKDMLNGQLEISFVCALDSLCDRLKDEIAYPLVPVRIHILYPWLE